jgi:hypothetical protein
MIATSSTTRQIFVCSSCVAWCPMTLATTSTTTVTPSLVYELHNILRRSLPSPLRDAMITRCRFTWPLPGEI